MKKVKAGITVAVLCVLLLTACAHEHVWKEATCATPVFCEGCGETKGQTLAHTWDEATCTAPKACSVCGKTEGDPLPHQWEDATCMQPRKCKVCEATEGASLGHEAAEWKTVTKATCQEEGAATGECVRCQETLEKKLEKLEHTPGEWKISVKATINEKGKRTQECTACKIVLEDEEYELSDKEYKAAYKEACKTYKYSKIARAPGQYKGKLAKFTGEVIQVQQDKLFGKLYYVLRVNVTKKGSYYKYYTDTIYVTYTASEDDARILEDDIITMYGELQGEKTYTTVLGSSVTIPSFDAKYISIK